MTDEFDEPDNQFEGFEDFLSGLHPGRTVSLGGGLRYREGGDARDWSAPGATKRIPGDWMMQIGVIDDTFASSVNGMIEVTFPQPFVDPPWVTACVVNTIPFNSPTKIMAAISSAAGLELYWNSAPISSTYMAISWMAIGPIGTS